MSGNPVEVNRLTESTYKNVMEQFNPGLRNLVILGKSYEKSVSAMGLAGKAYFDAVSKIGESAAVSPVSRELGVVLMEISEVHRNVQWELEESFKRFHREVITELERKTDLDVKYMNATFKRYQSEHKVKQDSLERTHADLSKLRRKSHGKHSIKYDVKETEYLQTLSSRQMDMQRFMADGLNEALLEEKRRFCFLVDKHCSFVYQMAAFHEKAKEIFSAKLPSWQDKCSDTSKVPDSIMTMIEGLQTPVSVTPVPSPVMKPFNRNSDVMVPPPAPTQHVRTTPLAMMFSQEHHPSPTSTEPYSDQDSLDDGDVSRSTSVSSDINVIKKARVQTIFPHTAGTNATLLGFSEGDLITLLIQEEQDGWLYGELEKTGKRGWFPSSYCRPYGEPVITDMAETPLHRMNMANLSKQSRDEEEEREEDQPVFLPPPDYSESSRKSFTPSPLNTVSMSNGTSLPPFLGGGNPFSTVRLRPTVTNDRSAPMI